MSPSAETGTRLHLVPVTLGEAKRFVGLHHRHNGFAQSPTWKFGVGVANSAGELVGVAIAGLPKSRMLMQADRYLLEVNRTCTDGSRNGNSMLYGAIARAAFALGYRRLITYTLESESGSSLRAAGWQPVGVVAESGTRWENGLHSGKPQTDLFGNERIPTGPKIRWERIMKPSPLLRSEL